MNNTRTKLNQAQRKIHLKHQGILNHFKTGCLSMIHIKPIIAPTVVYQNKTANLSSKLASLNT
jgi:hypothetical protein